MTKYILNKNKSCSSSFMYKVVVMSDANLGCSRDGQLRIGVGAATREGTTLHSASDCGPKPCAERRHTQAIRSLYVRCHNKRTMLRESEPRLTGTALFQFLLKFESFFEILYRRYFYLNQLKPV